MDNVFDVFKLHEKNGIYIKTWEGDENDNELIELKSLLKEIATSRVCDVRIALQKIRDVMFRLYLSGEKNPYKIIIKQLNNSLLQK